MQYARGSGNPADLQSGGKGTINIEEIIFHAKIGVILKAKLSTNNNIAKKYHAMSDER